MKLSELKDIIDQTVEYAEGANDPDVEVWLGHTKAFKISDICQGGVVPTVYITLGEKVYDENN